MGRAQGWWLLAAALPLGLVAGADGARAQPADPSAEAKSAEAEPRGAQDESARAGKEGGADEGLSLEKRLERLRSERSGSLEPVRLVPGARIAPATELTRQELGLPPPTASLERTESLPELAGPEKERWFRTGEWRDRFADLRHCRGEVAMRRQVRLSAVAAGVVLLRWSTDLLGRARDVAVVGASGRVDPDVMSCVHRKMGQWQVLPPPAAAYRADWTLDLRAGR